MVVTPVKTMRSALIFANRGGLKTSLQNNRGNSSGPNHSFLPLTKQFPKNKVSCNSAV